MSLLILLRLVHIVLGTLWVGMACFTTFFLMPAMRQAGPEGGKVMMALQRRGMMVVVPIIAVATVISGVALVEVAYGGLVGLTGSRGGLVMASGGLASVLAFVLGIAVMRPAMARATAIATSLDAAQDEHERAERAREVQRLRTRGAITGRVVAVLLLVAVAAMSVARYL